VLFSFQHTTGSWTADPQGSFPSFVAFCSPTLHDKDLIFPIFMDTPEYKDNRGRWWTADPLTNDGGDLRGSVGTCRYLWRSAGICGDLSGLTLGDILKTGCGAHRPPRPTAISPRQNSLQDWTDGLPRCEHCLQLSIVQDGATGFIREGLSDQQVSSSYYNCKLRCLQKRITCRQT